MYHDIEYILTSWPICQLFGPKYGSSIGMISVVKYFLNSFLVYWGKNCLYYFLKCWFVSIAPKCWENPHFKTWCTRYYSRLQEIIKLLNDGCEPIQLCIYIAYNASLNREPTHKTILNFAILSSERFIWKSSKVLLGIIFQFHCCTQCSKCVSPHCATLLYRNTPNEKS